MDEKLVVIDFTVDWIGATFDASNADAFRGDLYNMGLGNWSRVNAPKGYDTCMIEESGVRMAWHSKIERQGVHFQFSGKAIQWLANLGYDWHSLLTYVKSRSGRTSRVDLAVDIKQAALEMTHFSKTALLPYKGKGRTPKYYPTGTPEEGWTIYIGRRSSEKFLRIYDKAAEQGLKGVNYVRVELECKGELAHAIGWQISEMTRSEFIDMSRTLIRGQANFNNAIWGVAMESQNVGLAVSKSKEKDTMKWLCEQCAPALARLVEENPSRDILNEFAARLRDELGKRGIDAI